MSVTTYGPNRLFLNYVSHCVSHRRLYFLFSINALNGSVIVMLIHYNSAKIGGILLGFLTK